jgi:hypothetical protein
MPHQADSGKHWNPSCPHGRSGDAIRTPLQKLPRSIEPKLTTPTISNYAMSRATTQTHSLSINLTTNARIYNLPTRITSLAFLSYKQPNPTQLPPTPSMRMHILISSLSLYIRARLHPRVSSQGPKSHTTHRPGASCRASSHWAPNTTRRRKKGTCTYSCL